MILNDLPIIMLICLVCTIIVESIVAIILGIRNKQDILIIILVNIMTNPLVTSIPTYFYAEYNENYRVISLILLEIFAFISEGFVYKKTLNYNKNNKK